MIYAHANAHSVTEIAKNFKKKNYLPVMTTNKDWRMTRSMNK